MTDRRAENPGPWVLPVWASALQFSRETWKFQTQAAQIIDGSGQLTARLGELAGSSPRMNAVQSLADRINGNCQSGVADSRTKSYLNFLKQRASHGSYPSISSQISP
jgi:hypothetical protein